MKRALTARVHVGRFFRTIIPAFAILLVGAVVILSVLVYKISYPGAVPEPVSPSFYLLPSLDVTIPTDDGKEMPGWWIPGLKGAPGIILAPGYGMSRADALSLAALLHESGFNLLIYDQRGSGATPISASTLGLYETRDMLQAVEFMESRPQSNPSRLGIWGVDVSAVSALRIAAARREVRAIVADSAFESMADFLGYRVSEDFGLDNKLIHRGCFEIFRLVHVFGGSFKNQDLPLKPISDRMILFVKGENRRELGKLTTAIYDKIQPQKEMISFKAARTRLMSGEDLRSYDRQVANFFHINLQ
jgi:pimeloyl-ACP methyl ester carboxylesterase